MAKLNITQLQKLQEEGAKIELKSYTLVLSVNEHNERETKTIWHAIVDGKTNEINPGTAKKYLKK